MKRFKKYILAFLVVSVISCIIASCGVTNSEINTFLWYYPANGLKCEDLDLVNEKANEILMRKLGVKVKLCPVEEKYYSKKMSLVEKSEENFDICFTANWLNDFQQNVYNGSFYPITELLKNCPELEKNIPEIAWSNAKIDGEYYAVPNYQVLYTQRAICFEKQIYEKYKDDIEGIHGLKDLEPVLEKMHKDNPDAYLCSYSANADFWNCNENVANEIFSVKPGDTKAFCSYTVPEYEEYIKTFADWYKKGYVKYNNYIEVIYGDPVIATTFYKPGAVLYDENNNKRQVAFHVLEEPRTPANAGRTALTAISKRTKDPVKALKIIELANSDKEFYNTLCFGVEGIHYRKKSENLIEHIDINGYNPNHDWVFGNQFNAYYVDEENVGSWEETDRINKSAQVSELNGFVFDSRAVTDEIIMMEKIISDYTYLACFDNVEKNYDEFLKEMKNAGCDKALAELQRQIDEFMKNKDR